MGGCVFPNTRRIKADSRRDTVDRPSIHPMN
jgi:hypothetical protein